jgi:phage tail sheath protein FI
VGVHKAPANELLEGVLDVDVQIGARDQEALNEAGVNCLREWPGWGLRVWGAHTLSDRPELRYVNVTRLILALTRELERNLRDLVFEPHNAALWAAIEDRVRGYLRALFERGALKGRSASEAFYVKCNEETNSVEQRDAGMLVAQIGLAATAPAEFVIVRITQSASGIAVSGPASQA